MSGAHRIEVSANNRAVCKATECKKEGIKIQKGQIRYGTFVTTPDFQSWSWKHWGCVTPKQISNLKDSIEGDPNQIDGYEELPEDFQEKVARAVEQGHIDDEDWGWDIEMNREGKNGYFTAETKRRKKAEAKVSNSIGPDTANQALFDVALSDNPKALTEGSAEEGNANPSKTNKKKRGHVKDDPDAEGEANDEPPAKKTKARTKKESKVKNEDLDDGSENEASATKTPRPRVKKEPKIKNEDAETASENEVPAKKKAKAVSKKGKKASGNDADEDSKQDVQPVKKSRKQAKKATAGDETAMDIKDESGDHDALPPPKEKKKRSSRKAATAKKVKDEDTETDGVEPTSETEMPLGEAKVEQTSELESELSEDVPRVRKGRKGAPAKTTNGLAEKGKKKTKTKAKVRILSAFLIGL